MASSSLVFAPESKHSSNSNEGIATKDLPLLRMMLKDKKMEAQPEPVHTLILSYTSPKDLCNWAKDPLSNNNNYGPLVSLQAYANQIEQKSWSIALEDFKIAMGELPSKAPEEKEKCFSKKVDPTVSYRWQYQSYFDENVDKILNLLKQNPIDIPYFVSLSDNNTFLLYRFIIDPEIDNAIKAIALRYLIRNDGFSNFENIEINWEKKYTCDWKQPLNYLHCFSGGISYCATFCLTATETHCSQCGGQDSFGCCYCSLIKPFQLNPLLLTTLFADQNSVDEMKVGFPKEAQQVTKSLDYILSKSDNLFFTKEVIQATLKPYPHFARISSKSLTHELAKAAKIKFNKEPGVFSIAECDERAKPLFELIKSAETIDQLFNIYTQNVDAPFLNQAPRSCFFVSNNYSNHKITFILKIQQKIIEFLNLIMKKELPYEYLQICQIVLNHPVFSAMHCQRGVANTSRNDLLFRIQNLTNYLSIPQMER